MLTATIPPTTTPNIGIVSPMRMQEKVAKDEKPDILETVILRSDKSFEEKNTSKDDDEDIIPMKPLKLTEISSLRGSRGEL